MRNKVRTREVDANGLVPLFNTGIAQGAFHHGAGVEHETIETTLELEDVSDRRIDVATHAHVTDKTLGACRSFKRIEGTAASP